MMSTLQTRIILITGLAAALLVTPFSAMAAPHGGTGGSGALSPCGPYGAMIGITGAAGTMIDSVGAVCVRINRDTGAWDGNPYQAATHGGTGGKRFSSVCPNGQAMAGIMGRSGTMVDNLQVYCGTLAAVGGMIVITSPHRQLGYVGAGTGGAEWKDMCPLGRFMTGVAVRSGTLLDQISPLGCLQFAQTGIAPTNVVATAGNTQIRVAFVAAPDPRGYVAICRSLPDDPGLLRTGGGPGAFSPITVGTLTNGRAYACTVTDASGVHQSGVSNTVTPGN